MIFNTLDAKACPLINMKKNLESVHRTKKKFDFLLKNHFTSFI